MLGAPRTKTESTIQSVWRWRSEITICYILVAISTAAFFFALGKW
jgi:hypothetical protein